MMEDDISDPGNYRIRVPGVVELNIGDQWRAHWVDGEQFPDGVPATYVWALVYRGDRGYLIRPRGSRDIWSTVEGEPAEGETPEAFIERAALEQLGARVGRTEIIGYLDCRASSHNPRYPAGEMTVRPVYLLMVRELDDLPPDSPFERRRLSLSEHAIAIRIRYPELEAHLSRAAHDYAVRVEKGEALA